jgi:hypothetical protein
MRNKIVIISILSVLLFFCITALAQQKIVVVNVSSQQNALPATASLDDLTSLTSGSQVITGDIRALTDGRHLYPFDIMDGTVYIGVDIPPMGSAVLRPTSEKCYFPDWADEGGVHHINWPNGPHFRLDNTGIMMADKYIFRHARIDWWRKKFEGYALMRFQFGNITFDCFSNGGARVICRNNAALKTINIPMIRKENEHLIAREAMQGEIISPRESFLIEGFAVFAPAKSSKWKYTHGKIIPVDGDATAYIVTCSGKDDWHRAAAAASMPLTGVFQKDGTSVFKTANYKAVAKKNIPANVPPNLEAETWNWYDKSGKRIGKWDFDPANNKGVNDAEPQMKIFKDGSHKLTISDYSGKGIYFQGDLFRGGPLFSGKSNRYSAMDLDGDGDGDVYFTGTYRFDFRDELAGYYNIGVGGTPCDYRIIARGGPPGESIGEYDWMFNKSISAGYGYKGADRGFEEHLLYHIDSHDDEPVKGPAFFFFKTSDDYIDRMTMGGFGLTDRDHLAWNIEFDPLEEETNQPAAFRICQYEDPYGNKARFLSTTFPQDWDGKKLEFKKQGHRDIDYCPFAPWYRIAKENLYEIHGLIAAFAPDGNVMWSSEGMYGGSLTTGQRLDVSTSGKHSFVLYYSDLFGGLHLKDAEYGYQGCDMGHPFNRICQNYNELHQPWAVDMPEGKWQGGRNKNKLEGCRLESPMFLCYADRDRDGFFDTYLYDAENNGIFDKTLHYDESHKTILMRQKNKTTAWQYTNKIKQADYLIGNYNIIEQMYLEGLNIPPLVIRTSLSDSGVPIEWVYGKEGNMHLKGMMEKRPDFYIIARDQWQNKIGLDLYHSAGQAAPWDDMSPTGFSGLALQCAKLGLSTAELNSRFSPANLADLDVLIMPQPLKQPTQFEMLHLLNWVKKGGKLFIIPTYTDQASKTALHALVNRFDVDLSSNKITAEASVKKYGIRGSFHAEIPEFDYNFMPSFAQQIKHYSSPIPGLLDDFDFITCVGYPFQNKGSFESILEYDDKPVILHSSLGKGTIVISGIDIFCNRYINHLQYVQPRADNTWLMGRILENVLDDLNKVDIDITDVDEYSAEFNVTGKGGPLRIPIKINPKNSANLERKILVNEKPVKFYSRGMFSIFEVKPGSSNVKIIDYKNY